MGDHGTTGVSKTRPMSENAAATAPSGTKSRPMSENAGRGGPGGTETRHPSASHVPNLPAHACRSPRGRTRTGLDLDAITSTGHHKRDTTWSAVGRIGQTRAMPRSIWKGAISFGLVTIPIKLYSATEEKDISFRQVHPED